MRGTAVHAGGDRLALARRQGRQDRDPPQHGERQCADDEVGAVARAVETGDLGPRAVVDDARDCLAEAHRRGELLGHGLRQPLRAPLEVEPVAGAAIERRIAVAAGEPTQLGAGDVAQHRERRRVPHVGVVGADAHQVDGRLRDALLHQPGAGGDVEALPLRFEPGADVVGERVQTEHVRRLEHVRQHLALLADGAVRLGTAPLFLSKQPAADVEAGFAGLARVAGELRAGAARGVDHAAVIAPDLRAAEVEGDAVEGDGAQAAADSRARLEHGDFRTLLFQLQRRPQACEAGAEHEHLGFLGNSRAARPGAERADGGAADAKWMN